MRHTNNVQGYYPLSPLQEGMLFHHLISQRSDTYILSILFEARCKAALSKLIDALQRVVDRHESLRSAIQWEQIPRSVLVIYRHASLPMNELILEEGRDPKEQIWEYTRPSLQRLDLRRAPMGRIQVLAGANAQMWFALLQIHHVICDHESLMTVVEEVMAILDGREQDLPEPISYRDYLIETLMNGGSVEAERYFRDKLGSVHEPTAPFGVLEVHDEGSRCEEETLQIEFDLEQQMRLQAHRNEVSVARLFHAIWALVVAHTSGREDVVYGTVVLAARKREARSNHVLGMSVNTLPLRLQLNDITAKELVELTRQELSELLKYEQAPLALAQRCSGTVGTVPLFTALLNYRHSRPQERSCAEAGVRVIGRSEAWTNYPLVLLVDDFGDRMVLTVQADQRINAQHILRYVQTAMESLMRALAEAPNTPALALPVVHQEEWRKLVEPVALPYPHPPEGALIHCAFEEQVKRDPQSVALLWEGRELTYAALNERANQLAHHLVARGICADDLVAICIERSFDLVIAILGVLKSGAAYVPLDPTYPAERLAYILADTKPRLVLTQQRLLTIVSSTTADVLSLDDHWNVIAQQSSEDFRGSARRSRGDNLAYVIYTSGSTGQPKGVMVEHRHVMRLFKATEHEFQFNKEDSWTLFHSFAFDFSVWEIWGGLLYGGKVVVVPYMVARSPDEFYRLLCESRITVLNQTPSAFSQLIDAQSRSRGMRHSLRVVIFGGEALDARALLPWIKLHGVAKPALVNMYGITETTVHVTYRAPLTQAEVEFENANIIGKAISDLRVYILNRCLQPVPIGVPGEIYVGGAGVARGYLKRPSLTAGRFIANPFNGASGARLYKTGDVGRRRADGQMEYLGRNDDQVKIRGYRIELGEIEAQMLRLAPIKDVVVIMREDAGKEKQLVAYFIPDQESCTGEVPSAELLRDRLKQAIPEYMVPNAFVTLETMPLTRNGKIDRMALPMPSIEAYVHRKYEEPKGELEELVASVWQSLLNVKQIGRLDSFFELGGHSLLAMQAMARLGAAIGMELPVRSLFDFPTIKELSEQLESDRRKMFVNRHVVEDGRERTLLERVMLMSESEAADLLKDLTSEGKS